MEALTVALFGEAEKGSFHKPYFLQNLEQLSHLLGNPPPNSQGLFYAVQALLYERQLLFFRVQEEGFSMQDYLEGVCFLKNQETFKKITAICVPGLGNQKLIEKLSELCFVYKSVLVLTEADFYDYLTSRA